MTDKKTQFGDLKTIILILVAGLVLFVIAIIWSGVIQDSADKSTCGLSIAAASMTKIGGAEGWKIACDMKEINITFKELEKKLSSGKKEIDNYNSKNKDDQYQNFNSNDNRRVMEYLIDKQIASEMAKSWTVVGEGKLDLFSNYWRPVQKDKDPTAILPTLKGRTAYCIIFARFKFDDELKREFSNQGEITTLNEWMGKNKVMGKNGISYIEYLKDDQKKITFATDARRYKIDEPVAIVFARVNVLVTLNSISSFLTSPRFSTIIGGAIAGSFVAPGIGTVLGIVGGALSPSLVSPELKAKIPTLLNDEDIMRGKSYIFLMPYSKVGENCDVVMN